MQLKRIFTVLIVAAAFLAVIPLSVLAFSGQADTAPAAETLGPNLLVNPGLEGHYHQQCSRRSDPPWVTVPCDPANYDFVNLNLWATAQVPEGWNAWWRVPNDNQKDPNYYNTNPAYCNFAFKETPSTCVPWHNPEFRDTAGGPQDTGPERKMEGDNSQKYFTYYTIHEAGLYQQVGGVKPGDLLRFSAYMEAWSNSANDSFHSGDQQSMGMQVGIDPTGGNDPWSSNIVWAPVQESYDKFSQFVVEAVARNNVVSVWTRSHPVYAIQHNDVYVDGASLNVVTSAPAPKATKAAPARTTKTTKIITSTKVITSASGITSTVVVSKSVPVTVVTPAVSTKPVSGTVGATTPVTGTLPIPASGTYTVVKGDSLSKIARRFGVPLATLIALNNITDPNRIEAGQVLKLR